MPNYVSLAEMAVRLIEVSGRSVSLQKLSTEPVDANKPWKGAGSPTVATQRDSSAVFLPVSGNSFANLVSIDKDLLKRTDKLCLVAPTSDDLAQMDHMLDIDGIKWKILWVDVLKPADTIVLYYMGVAR